MIIFIFTVEKDSKWQRIANGLAQAKLYGDNWLTLKDLETQSQTGQNALQMSKGKTSYLSDTQIKLLTAEMKEGICNIHPRNLWKK